MANKSVKSIVTAVIAAAYGLANLSGAQAVPPRDTSTEDQDRYTDVLSTINRISAENPTAYLRVQVAQEAGRSPLTATLVQAISGAESPEQVTRIVADVIAVTGLNSRNAVSLEELLAALRAMGFSQAHIDAAISAYSVEVAEAVAAGTITSVTAAAILSAGANTSLYS